VSSTSREAPAVAVASLTVLIVGANPRVLSTWTRARVGAALLLGDGDATVAEMPAI